MQTQDLSSLWSFVIQLSLFLLRTESILYLGLFTISYQFHVITARNKIAINKTCLTKTFQLQTVLLIRQLLQFALGLNITQSTLLLIFHIYFVILRHVLHCWNVSHEYGRRGESGEMRGLSTTLGCTGSFQFLDGN